MSRAPSLKENHHLARSLEVDLFLLFSIKKIIIILVIALCWMMDMGCKIKRKYELEAKSGKHAYVVKLKV